MADNLTPWLLLAAWVLPLALAALQGSPPGQGAGPRGFGGRRARARRLGAVRAALLWLAPLPALAAALTVPVGSRLELPWLFLGTTLALDATARVYLLFTAVLWLAAGVHAAHEFRASPHGRRFAALFLLAMAGNLWLIVGADLISFYAGFAMMGLAAYGLVIHDGSPAALQAGKVYLVMALFGEVCLFAAIVLAVAHAGSATPTPAALAGLSAPALLLALVGLGVKAGLVPLHLWLPLAHPAAPVPASAVLSGTMIKVALLGWLRLLPVGALALPDWGAGLALAGLVTLFLALPVGLVQTDPKVVLAYSSIAKMGLMALLLGLILREPALAPVGVAALVGYAAFHALAKGGLFLGVGLRKHAAAQPWVLGGLVFLALALAGAPFTSGAVAKAGIKPILDGTTWPWLGALLALATAGTTLLMARFIAVSVATRPHPTTGWGWPGLGWAVLIGLSLLWPFALGGPAAWLTNAALVPAGLLLAAFGWWLGRRWPAAAALVVGRIPPGDLLVPALGSLRALAWLCGMLYRPLHALYERVAAVLLAAWERLLNPGEREPEAGLRRWPVAGTVWLGLVALLLVLVLGGPTAA